MPPSAESVQQPILCRVCRAKQDGKEYNFSMKKFEIGDLVVSHAPGEIGVPHTYWRANSRGDDKCSDFNSIAISDGETGVVVGYHPECGANGAHTILFGGGVVFYYVDEFNWMTKAGNHDA
jgi:hypothetical protein